MEKFFLFLCLIFFTNNLNAQTDWGKYVHLFNLQGSDPDVGDENYWTISAGNITVLNSVPSRKVFAVKPVSGEVLVDTTVYASFTTQKTTTLTFRRTDTFGLYAYTKRKIILKKDSAGRRAPSTILTVE